MSNLKKKTAPAFWNFSKRGTRARPTFIIHRRVFVYFAMIEREREREMASVRICSESPVASHKSVLRERGFIFLAGRLAKGVMNSVERAEACDQWLTHQKDATGIQVRCLIDGCDLLGVEKRWRREKRKPADKKRKNERNYITKRRSSDSTGFHTTPDRLSRTHRLTLLNLIQHSTNVPPPSFVCVCACVWWSGTREEQTS